MHSIESFLPSVAKPARYTGGEWNMARKDPASVAVRFALALPDVYEVGMSNLGLKILYGVLNDRQDTYAERAYCPWPDMEQAMRAAGTPLTSLETQTPLRDFDAVGISLQYEMTYSNILTMLDLGGIPLTSAERADTDPLIVGGGPCAYNPEPLADFFDCFVIGEGEEIIGELAATIAAWKLAGRPGGRVGLLQRLSTLAGIYVPAFYQPEYNADGTFRQVTPVAADAPAAVVKRIVKDLDAAPFPTQPIVPIWKPFTTESCWSCFAAARAAAGFARPESSTGRCGSENPKRCCDWRRNWWIIPGMTKFHWFRSVRRIIPACGSWPMN